LTTLEIVRQRAFWVTALGFIPGWGLISAVQINFGPYTSDLGVEPQRAAFFVSLISGSMIAGKLAFGALADRLDFRVTFSIVVGMLGLALLAMAASPSPELLIPVCIAIGLGGGGLLPLSGLILAGHFGDALFGRVMGLFSRLHHGAACRRDSRSLRELRSLLAGDGDGPGRRRAAAPIASPDRCEGRPGLRTKKRRSRLTAFALSKPYMDVGLFTNRGAEMREFYGGEIGLAPIDELDIETGYRLYRFDASGSALKINDLDEPMEPATTCFRRIVLPVADPSQARALEDPDGNAVVLVPMGQMDVTQLGIVWAVASLEQAEDFAERKTTLIFDEAPEAKRSGAMEAIGFTYTTLHVKDVFGTHAHLLSTGCQEAIPVTPFGEVTTYSFIRDPFGGWFEVSQRADLAGRSGRNPRDSAVGLATALPPDRRRSLGPARAG
jgi:hypothetical protein